MLKNENYSFSFFKRLIENIKQTEDAQNPKNEIVNKVCFPVRLNLRLPLCIMPYVFRRFPFKKLYAVCDLALSLVMSKTTNFILKEYPVEPLLPNKLFVNADPVSFSSFSVHSYPFQRN